MASVRRLAAILAADVAGYSRLMGADEEGTYERLKAHLGELVHRPQDAAERSDRPNADPTFVERRHAVHTRVFAAASFNAARKRFPVKGSSATGLPHQLSYR